ncbi:MAG: triose-phosphate isomerase [Polyangiaceae bacterium]
MTRTSIIGGNWKMNLTLTLAERLAQELRNRLGSHRGGQLVVFPPFVFIDAVRRRLRDSAVEVGGQDLHPLPKGAYTSGVSAEMLASLGCTRVLVGHSERRAWFGDSDARVAEKLKAALSSGLKPVLCIGETLEQRQSGATESVLRRQLETALGAHGAAALSDLVVAYEPVWAIGTGVTATPEQAQATHAFVRSEFARHFGAAFAEALRIQYGGSVTADNAAALLSCPDIDGALVGGASLDANGFTTIARAGARRS